MKVLEVNWGLAETFAQCCVASGVWHSFPQWDVTHMLGCTNEPVNTSFGTKRRSRVKMRQHWPYLPRPTRMSERDCSACQWSSWLTPSIHHWILDFPTICPQTVRLSKYTSSILPLSTGVPRGPVPLSVLSIAIRHSHHSHAAVQHNVSFLTWRHKRLM